MPKRDQAPNWQPISALARVAAVIDGQLAAVEDQHRMLVTAAGRPYSLDNATVERVARVFGETAEGLWLYDEQLRRWADRPLTASQRAEIRRLAAEVIRLRQVVADVLSLAETIKHQTIEALLAKSDLELAVEELAVDEKDFAWIEDAGFAWCLGSLRILFARGRSWQDMLAVAFGLDHSTAVESTLNDQATNPDRPTIRAGEHEGWGYTVETTLAPTDNEEQLERLSLPAGEAFDLTYTMTISLFRYASAGSFVSGFDMTLPQQGRWGDPGRFEAEMAEAGFLAGGPNTRLRSPRFVRLAFGVTMTREMIEGPLPSVACPVPERSMPPTPAPPPPRPIRPHGLG